MYIPQKYHEESWEQQTLLIQRYPLGTIVTFEKGKLIANHIPFVYVEDQVSKKKYLHAHIARVNHQVPSLIDNDHVLVIFTSLDSYVSPSFYPEKERTGKVTPTWDFAAVHVYGKLKIVQDDKFLHTQLDSLTKQEERVRPQPWNVDDAPEKYTATLKKVITGLQIEIIESECKYKFEQKMLRENVDGVVAGLAEQGKIEVSEFVRVCNAQAS